MLVIATGVFGLLEAGRADGAMAASSPESALLTPTVAPASQLTTPAVALALTPPPAPFRVALAGENVWVVDESDRGPVFFFEDEIAGPIQRPEPSLSLIDADPAAEPRVIEIAVAKGETLDATLRRAGVRAPDRRDAAQALSKEVNLRSLRPGGTFKLTLGEPNLTLHQHAAIGSPGAHLLALDYKPDAQTRVELARLGPGSFDVRKSGIDLAVRLMSIRGRIDGSLFLSAKALGAPNEAIADLANAFAYDIDFQRDIFGGDEFEAIFEIKYDSEGQPVGVGELIYGRLKWRGGAKEKSYYRFAMPDQSGQPDFFDASGQSAKRLLMKTPIDGARLSSGFGTRKHPILGYAKAHKGVDFAAPTGTPIKAAGDGVVERAGPYGGFGNYIRLKHASGYKTAYAHLHSIKKGVRAGARVRQGDIIGYVGSTGRSTGPHLHYEIHHNDQAVNPQKLKIATGVELTGNALDQFRIERDRIDALRARQDGPGTRLFAREDGPARSL